VCTSDDVVMAADEQVVLMGDAKAALEARTIDVEHELLMRSSNQIERHCAAAMPNLYLCLLLSGESSLLSS
jgi:hypothetical protein